MKRVYMILPALYCKLMCTAQCVARFRGEVSKGRHVSNVKLKTKNAKSLSHLRRHICFSLCTSHFTFLYYLYFFASSSWVCPVPVGSPSFITPARSVLATSPRTALDSPLAVDVVIPSTFPVLSKSGLPLHAAPPFIVVERSAVVFSVDFEKPESVPRRMRSPVPKSPNATAVCPSFILPAGENCTSIKLNDVFVSESFGGALARSSTTTPGTSFSGSRSARRSSRSMSAITSPDTASRVFTLKRKKEPSFVPSANSSPVSKNAEGNATVPLFVSTSPMPSGDTTRRVSDATVNPRRDFRRARALTDTTFAEFVATAFTM